jgi:hypothetical protein
LENPLTWGQYFVRVELGLEISNFAPPFPKILLPSILTHVVREVLLALDALFIAKCQNRLVLPL